MQTTKKKEIGCDRYTRKLLDAVTLYLEPAHEALKKKEPRPVRDQDEGFTLLFSGFSEIMTTLDALDFVAMLVGTAPPRSAAAKKDHYLKLLVSAYLQDVYILKERMNTYATRVMRLPVPGKSSTEMKARFEPLFTAIKATFDGLTDTRGLHVHDYRYTDERLDMLAVAALAERLAKKPFGASTSYMSARREWKDRMVKNNKNTRTFLDTYCDFLYPYVVKNDKLEFPYLARSAGTKKAAPSIKR